MHRDDYEIDPFADFKEDTDETFVEIEVSIKLTTEKAFLVVFNYNITPVNESTTRETWIPKSQILAVGKPNTDMIVKMAITPWIAKQKGIDTDE